ncbi:MAG TPA: GTP-binding protein [Candidatus Saccharimonadales bacterium]|nr:GTP-binding protein [Candidatus Saccharimonadales bacterium]
MKPLLYLINGPLGAGKTTFLKELIKQPGFKNARIIENEFASTSIDTLTLHDHTAEVRTIAGACICCGSSKELVEALQSLKDGSEPVVIEATGVANSLTLIEKMAAANIFDDYTLAHGVFVLDAAESTDAVLRAYADELRGADTVLVSKSDLITPAMFARVRRRLRAMGVSNIHKAINGVCDVRLFTQPSAMLAYFADFEGDIAPHDQLNYAVMQLGNWKIDPQKIHHAWPALQQTFNLRRLKGYGVAPDGTHWHIEATPSQCRIGKSVAVTPQLVWIGGNARQLTVDALKEACS